MNAKDIPPPVYTVVDQTSDNHHDRFGNEAEHGLSMSSSSQFNIDKVSIEYKDEGTIEAEVSIPLDRALGIVTENITSGGMLIIPDNSSQAPNTVHISAKVTAKVKDFHSHCRITTELNKDGDVTFKVAYDKSMWSYKANAVECQFWVRIPNYALATHPGLSVDIYKATIKMHNMDNICFSNLSLKTTQENISLLNIRATDLAVVTDDNVTIAQARITNSVRVMATGAGTSTVDDLHAKTIQVSAAKALLELRNIECKDLKAIALKNMLSCTKVLATGTVRLKSSGSKIHTSDITARSLYISSAKGSIEGKWTIRDLLEVTSNKNINATIDLQDPSAMAEIVLKAEDGTIEARLPAESFRGTFDILAPMNITKVRQAYPKSSEKWVPISYTRNWLNHKRGVIGNENGATRHSAHLRSGKFDSSQIYLV